MLCSEQCCTLSPLVDIGDFHIRWFLLILSKVGNETHCLAVRLNARSWSTRDYLEWFSSLNTTFTALNLAEQP